MMKLSASDAQYAIEHLVSIKRLRFQDIQSALAARGREIKELEARLEALRNGASGKAQPSAGKAQPSAGKAQPSPRVRVPRGLQKSRELQGQYLNLLFRVPKKDRQRYRALAKREGRQKAVEAMRAAIAPKEE